MKQNTTYVGSKMSRYSVEEHVGVDDTDRMLHTAVTGPTGQGKTNLLLWIALQDVYKTGFTFLNPKGRVIDKLLGKLPEDRLDDIVYINPNEDRVPGINLLKPEVTDEMTQAERNHQQKIIVSSVMGMFRRLTDEWGERWPRNLRSLLSAHVALNIHHGEHNTLMDLYQCVIDTRELSDLIDRTSDTVTREQLEDLKQLSRRQREPLKRRLSDLVENETVRNIITQRDSDISFRDALADQQIILVDAQDGQIGNWAASIIGSVVLTQLWSATAARSSLPAEDRPPYHILIDEIQEFVSEADHIRRMLSQCREFNVSITAATQYLDDLDTAMQRALLNNTLTKVVFTPGASEDLNTFTTIMNGLSKDDLSNLGKYRPAVQLPAEKTLPPAKVVDTYPPWSVDPSTVEERKEKLLKQNETSTGQPILEVDLGDGANAGGKKHKELLTTAKEQLEERGFKVNLLNQGTGDDKPDGHVHLSASEIAHLEAERATLSKPAKVLRNLQRAVDHGRECIFVVEEGNARKLQQIVADPVNRHGTQFEDEQGRFSYYTGDGGESFTEIDRVADAEYRILEISEDGASLYDEADSELVDSDGPEMTDDALRNIDRTILTCIREDKDDTHKITSATGLPTHKVNYSFDKLERFGLIQVSDPVTVERVTGGQKRVFDVKPVSLTPDGENFESG
ncbi:hypothetical protein NGM07_09545 [Halorussus vallis]|uniref:type IV secretory system conjugative DNA transfer family protein n=1 Tax=Halorussus vallis TaxID=2953749 RepID=UPI00209FF372|nr:hypothetical protein [Halorussus vallis]USZ77561.1 hypothetical protein NGM07_09545 [Halorussus vallis]